jgi:hypothetical protein
MNKFGYIIVFIVSLNIVMTEIYMGSPAWTETGTINWTGSVQTVNRNDPVTNQPSQYFIQPYSVSLSRGVFNFTAYVVLRTDLPQLGHNVTIVQDHDGTIYPK